MQQAEQKPQLGVSACLMGKSVRFDGGHKQNRFVLQECAEYFDLRPVCPEVELGLGIPRPVIQLRKFETEIKLVNSKNPHRELTNAMRDYSETRVQGFDGLDGFIFKKDSPTCGMERVPVFDNKTGQRERNGVGMFAASFKARYPNVPTEEEGRLGDIKLRENFLERVYAHYRWRLIENADNNPQALRDFHKKYKLVLMAKNSRDCYELGRLVANMNKNNLAVTRQLYFEKFMLLMSKIPSRGQHVNVLMHMLGYLKTRLDSRDKQELLNWFESYRKQQVNRITPMVLLQHHFNRHPDDYIAEQYYFAPFPVDLMQPV